MPERGTFGENLIPKYRFKWDDGSERGTENLPDNPEGIEVLAEMGRQDDECEVSLIGYET